MSMSMSIQKDWLFERIASSLPEKGAFNLNAKGKKFDIYVM